MILKYKKIVILILVFLAVIILFVGKIIFISNDNQQYVRTKSIRNDGIIWEWKYDKNGKVTEYYEYDATGKMVTKGEICYSDDYNIEEHYVYGVADSDCILNYHFRMEYQAERLVKKVEYKGGLSERCFPIVYTYKYDDKNSVIETSVYADKSCKIIRKYDYYNGEFFYRKQVVYDFKNNKIEGMPESKNYLEYDKDGNIIKERVVGVNYGRMNRITKNTYDENGNCIKRSTNYKFFEDVETEYKYQLLSDYIRENGL